MKETESNPFEGAELRHPVGSRRYVVIAGKYGGGVFCNLPDGTEFFCLYGGCLFAPAPALLNALAIVPLLLVIGKLVEQRAGEIAALTAMLVSLALTAGLHRAAVSPEWLVHMYAAGAVHLLPVGALGTQQSAS